jgi:hypothetical protein
VNQLVARASDNSAQLHEVGDGKVLLISTSYSEPSVHVGMESHLQLLLTVSFSSMLGVCIDFTGLDAAL